LPTVELTKEKFLSRQCTKYFECCWKRKP